MNIMYVLCVLFLHSVITSHSNVFVSVCLCVCVSVGLCVWVSVRVRGGGGVGLMGGGGGVGVVWSVGASVCVSERRDVLTGDGVCREMKPALREREGEC